MLDRHAKPDWHWPRRIGMAVFAAFLIALPFLPMLVFGTAIGTTIWAMLFVPALCGIIMTQLPLKTFLVRNGWRDTSVRPILAAVNVAQTLLVGAFWPLGLSLVGGAVLSIVAVLATMVWTGLDDRAIGPVRDHYLMEAS